MSEAVCIGGVLDGQRKPVKGRTLVGRKPILRSVLDYPQGETAIAPALLQSDLYRREIFSFGGTGQITHFDVWIVEGMTTSEAFARVLVAYGSKVDKPGG